MPATAGKTLEKSPLHGWLQHALKQDPGGSCGSAGRDVGLAGETAEAIGRYELVLQADPNELKAGGPGTGTCRFRPAPRKRNLLPKGSVDQSERTVRRPISSPSSKENRDFQPAENLIRYLG